MLAAMRVLVPLPEEDFDPTEAAVPWKLLTAAGHALAFATPTGRQGRADPRVLHGTGFGPLSPFLRARSDARQAYAEMTQDDAFRHPKRFEDVGPETFDALILPGGHAPGMRPYLDSTVLHQIIADAMRADKPVGAICHGVLAAARADGVLEGRRTTCLLQSQEMLAYQLTRLWLGKYYRTYDETVQAEVTRLIGPRGEMVVGPKPLLRDALDALQRGFALRDGNYVSARWPGDAYSFTQAFTELLTD
jgi:putative intracellular protease/amidase